MSFDNLLNKKILLTQIRSSNKLVQKQKSTLSGLGLNGISSNRELLASKEILGMVKKVSHLIKVSAL
ncbi:MAG: large subunit ribosomal protein L30 [Lentimonas sp.]|jgi:large subunit ribosomal protein L30